MRHRRVVILAAGCAAVGVASGVAVSRAAASPAVTYRTGPITDVSAACRGQNAEVEQAVDASRRYVYVDWMGCHGIGFARSADGGRTWSTAVTLPGSEGRTWDPAIAVSNEGTVYASFMVYQNQYAYPVVDASFDDGVSFPQSVALRPPYKQNWGDRDFIAVGPHGQLYVTWDYGPSAAAVTYLCSPQGSCAFATGDLNVVIQRSLDGGKTWSPITPVSPGFPASGGDLAPLLVRPDGTIDAEYQGYDITNPVTYTMTVAHSYFTSSRDAGRTWSPPVRVGPPNLGMDRIEWWIDGDISTDSAGNLYITWDSQSGGVDIGWLAYSTDGGRTWSPPVRVTPDTDRATHIVQVAGGADGIAYVGWLSDDSSHGYAQHLRAFAIGQGWLSAPYTVSRHDGRKAVWPGDTFGISTLPASGAGAAADEVVLSWGSALGTGSGADSEIYAAVVRVQAG